MMNRNWNLKEEKIEESKKINVKRRKENKLEENSLHSAVHQEWPGRLLRLGRVSADVQLRSVRGMQPRQGAPHAHGQR